MGAQVTPLMLKCLTNGESAICSDHCSEPAARPVARWSSTETVRARPVLAGRAESPLLAADQMRRELVDLPLSKRDLLRCTAK